MKKVIVSLLLYAIIMLFTLIELPGIALASTSECEREIVFLPQFHENRMDPKQPIPDFIASAQFQILDYLKTNRTVPVFAEAVYSPLTMRWFSTHSPDTIKEIKSAFSSGIPDNFESLNSHQKELLGRSGGDICALILGIIPEIYPTAPDERTEMDYFKKAAFWHGMRPNADLMSDPNWREIGGTRRERLALEQITNFYDKNPVRRKSILIYGARHDFQRYPELIAPGCIQIPDSFIVTYQQAHPAGTTYRSNNQGNAVK